MAHSRGGKFDAKTTDNDALQLLKEAMDRFGWLTGFVQVQADTGAQFYANKQKWLLQRPEFRDYGSAIYIM
ncbi:MAG: hypothetical protein PHS80_07095 [Methanothrix sp.]|nr:hypothetical protein [Methanothrix sp.]MDD4447238.1 hypothetical protein [Methanothrix sp.]